MISPQRSCALKKDWCASTAPATQFGEAVHLAKEQGIATRIRHEYWGPKTQPLGTGGDMHFAFSYATQAALVSVDLNTGAVHVEKVISATDIGRAINPLLLQGQIEGGIVMAMGNCLTESYIIENGVPWSTLLARYKMPSIKHTPEIISHLVEDRSADGPYGAKGVGEIPSPSPPAPPLPMPSYHAAGVRIFSIPVDQDALLRAMQAGQAEVEMAGATTKRSPCGPSMPKPRADPVRRTALRGDRRRARCVVVRSAISGFLSRAIFTPPRSALHASSWRPVWRTPSIRAS